MVSFSDEEVEEYESLLPPMWNPAINPPEPDTISEHGILCEYCGNDEANNLMMFFLLPFLCCDGCKQLTLDDAHYAIGLV